MQPVPAHILESFQTKFAYNESVLIPYHLGEEGSDGAIYRLRDRDILLKICLLGRDDLRKNRLRFEKRLDFLSFLFERGVPVVEPVPTYAGMACEAIDDESGCWMAYAMKKTPGQAPSPKVWDPDFIDAWGRTIGRLHRVTREYPQWKKTIDPGSGEVLLDWQLEWESFYNLSEEPEIQEEWQNLYDELQAFPVNRECFGLVHNDPHLWNLRWDGRNAILLDFEVANHHWFLNDIAIAPQHVLFMLSGGLSGPMHHPERLGDFLRVFLNGYSRENHLPEDWQTGLKPFIAYRRLLLYTVMAGWRREDPELQASWKKMILHRPNILGGIKL